MPCDYEYDEDEKKILVRCSECIYGSSIENSEECMANTIDMLLDATKAQSIVYRDKREYEYPNEQIKLLKEIGYVIEDIISDEGLGRIRELQSEGCERLLEDKYSEVQNFTLGKLRKDPIGAYIELRRKIRHIKLRIKKTSGQRSKCYEKYLEEILYNIMDMLSDTELISRVKNELSGYHLGDREIYRDIFQPIVRPNFMRTKYMSQPPEGGELIDNYTENGIDVQIYRLPDESRPVYQAIPPEFKLDEDEYSILDAARRYMSDHQPEATGFADDEKARDFFSSVGRDLIRDLAEKDNTNLGKESVEKLTSILTRYTAGLGIIEVLLYDDNIQDIYINAPIGKKPVFINHAEYGECRSNLVPTMEDAEAWSTRLKLASGRPLDEANPVLDTSAVTPGGSARITVITRTLSPKGLGFAIRRHRKEPWTYPLYLKPDISYINPLFAGLMSFIIDGGRTFLVGGGRGSGKSSFLGASMLEMMMGWRVLTVEDTLELPVESMKDIGYDIQRLKSRSVITQVETELPASETIRTALRLGDSALIIGEVRSKEAQALYEAMRIGAMAKTVAGTIHGESVYGLYDRVVNDLDVPATSFKATDIVIICNRIKSASGLSEVRRITSVSEVRKHWSDNPLDENGFVKLMEYSPKEDELKPTDTLLNGESEVLNSITSQVKEWSGRWDRAWANIQLRGKVKKTITDYALETNTPEIMEAPFVVKSNEKFRVIGKEMNDHYGYIPPEETFNEWEKWLKEQIKKM